MIIFSLFLTSFEKNESNMKCSKCLENTVKLLIYTALKIHFVIFGGFLSIFFLTLKFSLSPDSTFICFNGKKFFFFFFFLN